MIFARRLLLVSLAIAAIVAAGWGLKQYEPVNSYFQKGPPPDGVAGAESEHTPKAGESRAADSDNQPTGAGEFLATGETVHPGDKDESHERWPALNFDDAAHTSRFMIPTITLVVIVDMIRRRRRKPARTTRSRPTPTSVQISD